MTAFGYATLLDKTATIHSVVTPMVINREVIMIEITVSQLAIVVLITLIVGLVLGVNMSRPIIR